MTKILTLCVSVAMSLPVRGSDAVPAATRGTVLAAPAERATWSGAGAPQRSWVLASSACELVMEESGRQCAVAFDKAVRELPASKLKDGTTFAGVICRASRTGIQAICPDINQHRASCENVRIVVETAVKQTCALTSDSRGVQEAMTRKAPSLTPSDWLSICSRARSELAKQPCSI